MTAVEVVSGPVTGVTAVTGHYFLVRLGKKNAYQVLYMSIYYVGHYKAILLRR